MQYVVPESVSWNDTSVPQRLTELLTPADVIQSLFVPIRVSLTAFRENKKSFLRQQI